MSIRTLLVRALAVLAAVAALRAEPPAAPPVPRSSGAPAPGEGGQPAAAGPFTVVVLPDTQYYTQKFPDTFHRQTAWIRENAAKENVAFVTQVGDIVENGAQVPEQWKVADESMAVLDGVVPWGVACGNHDYDTVNDPKGVATEFPKHFGPDRFRGRPGYGGASGNGLNSVQYFTAGGREWQILHLEGDVPDAAIRWAEEALAKHPGVPAILTTHIYLHDVTKARKNKPQFRAADGNSGEQIWDKLVRKQPQIFLVLCGHQWVIGEWRQVSVNDAGRKVNEVLSDYQGRTNGGDGWLRLMRFDPGRNEISVRTYSPTLDKFETDEDSEFTLALDLPAASDSPPRHQDTK